MFQMKTLDNIMHAKLIVRGESLRGIFDKSEIFSCFQMKIGKKCLFGRFG